MYNSRIRKLQIETPCLIENPIDLFYLTGLILSKGYLLVFPDKEAKLFVDGRYYEKAKKEAPCPVFPLEEFKLLKEKQIGFDSAFVTFDESESLKKELPHIEWIPISSPLKLLRAIKDSAEISALKRAAQLTLRGIEVIAENLREGVSEEELALEFEIFCRKNGASRLSFDPIIAFGENSAFPHHRSGKARLKKGQSVLIDVGAVVDSYSGDITRVFHLDGQLLVLEKIVKEAKAKAISQIKPGVQVSKLDEIVRDHFEKMNVKQLYTHSLGHGVGLQTHEFPKVRYDAKDILQEGMVITIEPGLYLPGIGGVRLEDMILVTKEGHLNLA